MSSSVPLYPMLPLWTVIPSMLCMFYSKLHYGRWTRGWLTSSLTYCFHGAEAICILKTVNCTGTKKKMSLIIHIILFQLFIIAFIYIVTNNLGHTDFFIKHVAPDDNTQHHVLLVPVTFLWQEMLPDLYVSRLFFLCMWNKMIMVINRMELLLSSRLFLAVIMVLQCWTHYLERWGRGHIKELPPAFCVRSRLSLSLSAWSIRCVSFFTSRCNPLTQGQ